MFSSQVDEWELAKTNYRELEKVKTRSIAFDGFEVLIQFNPGRILSSSAKVDARSIEARPCFLCSKNRPPMQKGLSFEPGMTILINPFPIFKRHLTVVADKHVDQRIKGNFSTMMRLSEALPDFQIFYNGPQCGASAPDHFHFQAVNKGCLPVEHDFQAGGHCDLYSAIPGIGIWQWHGYKRGVLTLKGKARDKLEEAFDEFYRRFALMQPDRPEPMLNILASFAEGEWTVHIFPRGLHRPSQFYDEGTGRILLSPASVDMGGVVITPREEDFMKINKSDLTDIFNQVTLNENEVLTLITDLV